MTGAEDGAITNAGTDVNGDDDMAMAAPAPEEGGGGMEPSQPMAFDPSELNEFKRRERRGKRRHPRPHFREERKARRTKR